MQPSNVAISQQTVEFSNTRKLISLSLLHIVMNAAGMYRYALLCLAGPLVVLSACAPAPPQADSASEVTRAASVSGKPAAYEVVDCLLPGQVRRLGTQVTYVTSRRPVRTTEEDCLIRGGEYVAYDRANYATALRVWQEAADHGDRVAQTHVGEIYEKGLGIPPDYARAASWYQKAADQDYRRALTNLAYLYEKGLGVERNPQKAVDLYRRAVGLPPTVALTEGASSEELRALRQELVLAYRKLQDAQVELSRVQATAAQKEEEIKRLEDEIKKLRVNSQADPGTLRKVQDELNRSRQDLERFKAQTASAEAQLRKYRDTVGGLNEKVPGRIQGVAPGTLNFGDYYAVVIGNNNYQNHPVLKTAGNDARAVADLLEKKYRFKTELLIDAKHAEMTQALYGTANRLGPNDNLLIYFAGHGQLLEKISRGYWLPIDASKELGGTWVSTQQLRDIVSISNAKHIIVVADSCFAGALVRGAEELPMPSNPSDSNVMTEYVRRLAQANSRHALTAGGLTPVIDTIGVGQATHSIFAAALLEVLGNNSEVLSGHAVWEQLSPRVTAAASRVMNDPQKPEYSAMFGPGHDAGEFFFAPSIRSAAASPQFVVR